MVASYLGLKDAEVESKLVSRDFGRLASQLIALLVLISPINQFRLRSVCRLKREVTKNRYLGT